MRVRAAVILLTLAAVGVLWGLLRLYAISSWWVALVDSALYVGLLGVAGFYDWYLLLHVQAAQARRGIALVAQLFAVLLTYAVVTLAGMESDGEFLRGLPLRVVFGLLCWTDLMLWYRRQPTNMPEETDTEAVEADEVVEAATTEALIDRISVKEGSRIHLIYIDQLLCIRASGDYALLVTADGQYLKEQTMKYFETHLPGERFVRIHRSCIVGVAQISRVELFGKENYQVRLSNGTTLRASAAGYRLLRRRLNL
jgi:hypothetical protein